MILSQTEKLDFVLSKLKTIGEGIHNSHLMNNSQIKEVYKEISRRVDNGTFRKEPK